MPTFGEHDLMCNKQENKQNTGTKHAEMKDGTQTTQHTRARR